MDNCFRYFYYVYLSRLTYHTHTHKLHVDREPKNSCNTNLPPPLNPFVVTNKLILSVCYRVI